MIDAIAGAFAALKGASDITQGLLSLKTDAAVSAKALELNRIIFEVQQQLIATQTDYAAVVSRERDLKAQIAQLENWAHEKERYQLHELVPGTFVYRVKPAMKGSEPMHDLCPRCYEDGVKSILQQAADQGWHRALVCPKCEAVFLGERIQAFAEIVPGPGHDYDPYSRGY